MTPINKKNKAINVRHVSNNSWKSKLNRRVYSLALALTVCINIFSSPLLAFAYDYTIDETGHIDEFGESQWSYFIGSAFAKFGYIIDGQENLQMFSNGLTNVANKLLTDKEMEYLNLNYTAGTDAYYNAMINKLVDNGDMILDNQNNSMKLSSEMVELLKESMTEKLDYILIHVPAYNHVYLFKDHQPFTDCFENSSLSNNFAAFRYSGTNNKYGHFGYQEPYSDFNNNVLVMTNGNITTDLAREHMMILNEHHEQLYNASRYGTVYPDFSTFEIYSCNINTGLSHGLITKRITFSNDSLGGDGSPHPRIHISNGMPAYICSDIDTYVPVFVDYMVYSKYMSGGSSVYIYDSGYDGGDLDVNLDIDYDKLNKQVREAIADADIVSPFDVQFIIKNQVEQYLKDIEKGIDDIGENTKETNKLLQKILDIVNAIKDKVGSGTSGISDKATELLEDIKKSIDSGFNWIKTELLALILIDSLDIADMIDELLETDVNELIADIMTGMEQVLPFSLLYDVAHVIELFDEDPVSPYFHIEFAQQTFMPISFDLDLVRLDPYMQKVRAFECLIFLVTLIGLTIKFLPIIKGD